MARRVAAFALLGVGIYIVGPGLVELLSEAPRLATVELTWLGAALAAQGLSLASFITLTRLSLGGERWPLVTLITLSGNAAGKILPAGLGGAVQVQMAVRAGVPTPRALTGFAAVSVVITAVPFALPLLSLPAIVGGLPVARGLARAAIIGAVLFVTLAVVSAILLASNRPLEAVARGVQTVRNRLRPRHDPVLDMPERAIRERDLLIHTLGPRWWKGLLAAVARASFDYLSLVACLAAVGARPSPALVLLAYVASVVLALIPLTPGGVGFVEAGLVGTLGLAGVGQAEAVLATLAYRLVSYWLHLPIGGVAYAIYQRRYSRSRANTVPG